MPEVLTKPYTPQPVDDATLAFPAHVKHLMPPYADIPEEFKNFNSRNKWAQLVSDWFFRGIQIKELQPKEGVDPKAAMRHIKAIIGSFEPKHEHKEAACAYLLSQWFDDIKYETASPRKERV